MSKGYLDPPEWYASLPTAYMSACVLLTDDQDRVLLVKPNYRPYWAIPGGIVEANEAPHECAAREIAEELGLTVQVGDLLVVDWAPPMGQRPRTMMNFLFDGGTIADPAAIRMQTAELDDVEFFSWEDAAARLPASTAGRIPSARRARRNRRTAYLPAEAL
ncbi:NUDIX hydrolase [Microtetraspora sp. NBRC 16547]|uniref:NUDIX domain-containing protein n=1 Tax=Microtetraspora sp. NBRC 16547 TaxID=3030993 RepID=UPI0024A08D12|nr:NUDIX hydrolase [Microtetraspora sp. NBRC 16547]GLX00044.1 hypothetical protein Misp02_41300 [Microtetraspora sp. NBRC 16547]